MRRSAVNVDARVTILGVVDGDPRFVIADSEVLVDAIGAEYPAATGAALSGATRSGIETIRGRRTAQTAFPIPSGASPGAPPGWIVVLSSPLDDVEDAVSLIRRQILIAGAIALLAALILAYLAASTHARRLRRLEQAAERVARGDFSVPIPVGPPDEVGQLAMTLDETSGGCAGSTPPAASSSPTPHTSCGRRSPRSAASSSCSTTIPSPTRRAAASSCAPCAVRSTG